MFEIITLIVFIWLLAKTVGLAVKLTWGAAKVIASILIAVALPLLILCLVFAGGVLLLLPLLLIALAGFILRIC